MSEFPHERLLMYYRGDLVFNSAEIEAKVKEDPQWRFHWNSLKFLDLERCAAKHDGAKLTEFLQALQERGKDAIPAEELPLLGAFVTQPVFEMMAREGVAIAGISREVWSTYINRNLYPRRCRRVYQAKQAAITAGLPGEVSTREWLLAKYYEAPLAAVTEELKKLFATQ